MFFFTSLLYMIMTAIVGLALLNASVLINFYSCLKGAETDLVDAWDRLERHFIIRLFKSRIFGYVLGRVNPYSRSIALHINELKRGYAAAVMQDRSSTRSPYKCQHAGALITFAETMAGLAVRSALLPTDRAILVSIQANYIRKARGPITGSASFKRPEDLNKTQKEVVMEIVLKDFLLETVAEINLIWLVENM